MNHVCVCKIASKIEDTISRWLYDYDRTESIHLCYQANLLWPRQCGHIGKFDSLTKWSIIHSQPYSDRTHSLTMMWELGIQNHCNHCSATAASFDHPKKPTCQGVNRCNGRKQKFLV